MCHVIRRRLALIPALLLMVSWIQGVEAGPRVQRWEGRWASQGVAFPFAVTYDAESAAGAAPVVVYLRHLSGPRVGTDSDEAITADLQRQGVVLVELDCREVPDGSPQRERTILRFNERLPALLAETVGDAVTIDMEQVHYVPASYRLALNVPFFDLSRHGAHGTLERIVRTYNGHVVERFGVAPVDSSDEMKGPDGEPIDYRLYMDIVYPSGSPEQPVPLIVHFATNTPRMKPFTRMPDRMLYPIGLATSGYAFANVDHCYNPLARSEVYGYWNQYSLEDWNGLASATAAIRYLRAHASEYGHNGRIGAMGLSKASYSVIRLADPEHPEQQEHFQFRGFPPGSPERQPWQGYSSAIEVGFASAGNGTRRVEYVNQRTVPLVTAAGRFDEYRHWDVFPRLVARAREQDVNHLALWMEDMNHTYPTGTDLATGLDRYVLLRRFFDQHLHPNPTGDEALKVLFILPREDADDVRPDGTTRALTADADLPDEMQGISPYRPITVRFARSVDVVSVTNDALRVRDERTAEIVPGEWSGSLKDSCFEFTPAQPLKVGTYVVSVSPGIRDVEGRSLAQPVTRRFTIQ